MSHAPSAALSAETAMKADIFILHHDPTSFQSIGDIQILSPIKGRGGEARPQVLFRSVGGEGMRVCRADIGTRVALDAYVPVEHRLDVTVQATLRLGIGKRPIKAEFHFGFDVLQSDCFVAHGHFVA